MTTMDTADQEKPPNAGLPDWIPIHSPADNANVRAGSPAQDGPGR